LALPYQWQYRLDRWKAALQGFFGRGNQQPRPKICPSCGSLVGISATRCHQCGTNLRFSMAAVNRSLSGVFSGPAPVTTALLVSNLLMFGVEWMALAAHGGGGGLSILWGMGLEGPYRLGMSAPSTIIYDHHQWFRLITAMFLHGGLIHIGFNMMALMQLGPALEELYGSSRYFFLYIFTGVFGFLASSFTGHYSLGASGGLLGLVGAMLAITTKRGGAYMRELRSRLVRSVVILFVLGAMPGMAIDNWAHGAGLAAGFVLGKIFADRQPINVRERQIANALGWLAAIAVIVSFAFMILHYRDPIPGQA
jgi:rhomboid protease GluP